ncbi:S9 family peptidase [Muribaculum caecicola]|uniref:Alpha/beta hydrolase n=2 Tax=Muribaculum TaxID=1918540 RepID=A0AC61S6N1_9BACT|nr:alpha/beta fold hydrolase [Muribaculum caecicola]THG53868.1 alpha/beta hydrolase [Muribaculum caecicola]
MNKTILIIFLFLFLISPDTIKGQENTAAYAEKHIDSYINELSEPTAIVPADSGCKAGQNSIRSVADLWISNGNRKIYGIMSTPKNSGQNGVAIISHGFNGTHHFGKDYFETLNNLNYTVYAFDFPSGSLRSQSNNNTADMSIIDEKNDIKAIVRYFLSQNNTDKKQIVLIGESQGGFVSALAAAELKDTVNSLILIYPALCIPDNWNKRYATETEIPDTTYLWNVPIGKQFFKELRGLDVYKTIAGYNGPVLIIHGAKDPIVPISYSEMAMKCYSNARLVTIPEAGHGFNNDEKTLSNKFVKEFLETAHTEQ